MKKADNKCVVKFENEDRKITLYFKSDEEGGLDMSMEIGPEFNPEKEEEPDLAMMLCSSLISTLQNTNVEDDLNPKVYAGTD